MATTKAGWPRRATSVALACVAIVQMLRMHTPEALHEIVGVLFGVLLVAHIAQHRSWFTALAQGKWNALRAVNTVVVFGLALCAAVMLASGLAMSGWAVDAGINASGIARAIHLPGVHIGFCLLALHAGLQMHRVAPKLRKRINVGTSANIATRTAWILAGCAIIIFALWSLADLDFAGYIMGTTGFAFIDTSKPILLSALQYAAIFALCAGVGNTLNSLLQGAANAK